MPPAVSLDDMLAARDRRHLEQQRLRQQCPGAALLSLTIVAPGSEKSSPATLLTFDTAVKLIEAYFPTISLRRQWRDLATGPEALFAVDGIDTADAKRRATSIEDSHPLGRLFDIDVIDADGRPVSRSATGAPPRRCLLCGEDARICMRRGTHSYTDLTAHIKKMTDEYFRR